MRRCKYPHCVFIENTINAESQLLGVKMNTYCVRSWDEGDEDGEKICLQKVNNWENRAKKENHLIASPHLIVVERNILTPQDISLWHSLPNGGGDNFFHSPTFFATAEEMDPWLCKDCLRQNYKTHSQRISQCTTRLYEIYGGS